jgi:tetratricopeptide (TPR) repeat protein
MIATHKLFLILTIGLAMSQLITGNSPLLQVYAHFKLGASGYPQFEGKITVGEQQELPIEICLANEEGGQDVLLPDGFWKNFVVRLEKDGNPIPCEQLEFLWGHQVSKYVYVGQPKFDSTDFSTLESLVGAKISLTIKLKNGEPFGYGDYKVQVDFNKRGLQFTSGVPWEGRLFAGRDSLRISEVKTIEDVKLKYALEATDALFSNQLEKAQEIYERLIILEPQNPHYHAGLATVFLRLRRYEQAAEHFERALPIVVGPDAPRTTVPQSLALAYVAMGREDKAVEIVRQFITADEKKIPEVLRQLGQQLKR